MKYAVPTFLLLLATAKLAAQAPVDYSDVAVIINDSDTNSVAIGSYFVQQRNVPLRNVIHIRTTASETITDSTFEDLRRQVETAITGRNLTDSLNYIVTTKGVPLRVNRGGLGGDLYSLSASVDAELMLILGRWSDHIGQATLVMPSGNVRVHPYFGQSMHYRRKATVPGTADPYDMYLVTRLIGLTKEDVFALIDHSGPFTVVNKDSALFVLDKDPTPIDARYNGFLDNAAQTLTARGWRVLLNTDSVYVTGQRNVLGYVSWGSNDDHALKYAPFARPGNTWSPAAIAETYVSTSARNFIPGQTSGQSRIADLIEEGCAGASGYVFEPFSLALTWAGWLFDRYTGGYNLAESFFMANPTMSWMAVVVGDPKTSIITATPPLPHPSIAAPATACAGDVITLEARNALPGNMYWFRGDSNAVKAAGPPFDERHPAWIGGDSVLAKLLDQPGSQTFTFANINFVGTGFAEITVNVFPTFAAGFTQSSDSVYIDEGSTVQFTDTSSGAVQWSWDFGDGSATSTEASPSHTYTNTGRFTVKLTVSNGSCARMVSRLVTVESSRQFIVLSTESIDFGLVKIGTNAQRVFRLLNKRKTGLIITNAGISGANRGDFSLNQYTFPFVIMAGDSATWFVTFAPLETDLRIAEATVNTDGEGSYTVQLSGFGTTVSSGVAGGNAVPHELRLAQNYPNPFNPVTTIEYTLPTSTPVRLLVKNMMGETVRVLINSAQTPGIHRVVFDASALPPGTYLGVLETPSGTLMRMMTVVK